MKKELKLEVGKTYLNRMGNHVKIVSRSASGIIFFDAEGLDYYRSGKCSTFADSPNDLIEEAIPATLPKNWVVKGAIDEEVYDYLGQLIGDEPWFNGSGGGLYYGVINGEANAFNKEELTDDTVILTFEEFVRMTETKQELTTKETEMENIQRISRENLKEIVDVACSSWKTVLSEKAKEQDALSSFVELDNEFVLKMYEAASSTQKVVLDKFLKEPSEPDLVAIPKGLIFKEELLNASKAMGLGDSICTIGLNQTKPEYKGRGLYVSKDLDVVVNELSNGGTEIVFLKRKG